MLPADAASFRVVAGNVVPDWLGPVDHPWLRDLLDRVTACAGRTQRELDQALARPLPHAAPPRRLRMAIHVVRRWVEPRPAEHALEPQRARDALFDASSAARRAGGWDRDRVLAEVARGLGVGVEALLEVLFGDLPAERRVAIDAGLPSPDRLALEVNLALAQGLARRATTMSIRASGSSRDLVRHVRLQRLLCVARPVEGGVVLEVSGPFALFRRTTLYGRAYASVLPRLPWCERFALEARCAVRGGEAVLRLGPEDPLFPSVPPRRFDSQLEEAFARAMARRFPDWGLVREPEPVEVDGALMFPDFALYRLCEPSLRWRVEIVGFWTPEYLSTKLERLSRAARDGGPWIVCIDERLNCSAADLPPALPVVRFRRRIDPAAVIARATPPPPPAEPEQPGTRVPLAPRDYFLDWAGRSAASDAVHARLAALAPGDAVRLVARDGHCLVVDRDDQPLAALSSAGRAVWTPRLERVVAVTVRALLERRRAQSRPPYAERLRVERWTVPLVDVWMRPHLVVGE